MIVRNVKDVIGTADEVRTDTWMSRRVLLKKDNMGFSFHETTIFPGTRTHIHYKNHLEAVWCIEGDGSSKPWPTASATTWVRVWSMPSISMTSIGCVAARSRCASFAYSIRR